MGNLIPGKQIVCIKIIAISLLIFPQTVPANAGVPMIVVIMPVFVLSLIPIIFVEALYLKRRLNISGKTAAKTAVIANLVSTFVGVPLTWLLLLDDTCFRCDIVDSVLFCFMVVGILGS